MNVCIYSYSVLRYKFLVYYKYFYLETMLFNKSVMTCDLLIRTHDRNASYNIDLYEIDTVPNQRRPN